MAERVTFADLLKKAEEKKKDKPKLEVVPKAEPGLPQIGNVVDQPDTSRSTTKLNVVDKITTEPDVVDKLTTKAKESGKQKDLSTTNKKVVNQNKRNWSTTELKRSEHSAEVESYRTSKDFKRKIKVFCAEKGIEKQDFYRIVVNHYFDTVVNHKDKDVVDLSTYDDREMILWKTTPRIINLYLRYNANFNEKTKWTARDDDAGSRLNNIDIRLVELGIIQTQANKGFTGKINSFSYYLPEIQTFIELKMDEKTLDIMLGINRQSWQRATGRELDLSFLSE